ncbi:flagellar basal body rod protein FlgF, partial [Salmonella enterica subsp. enterica serovar Heidelberg str. RI-11-013374]
RHDRQRTRFEMQMKVITSVDENEGRANQLLSMS